jgi:hypothetical protein
MIGRSAADAVWQESTAIHDLIKNEIQTLQNQQRALRTTGSIGYITLAILLLCILVNVAFLVLLKDYFALFISAGFYLFMIYFITLIIPLGNGARDLPFNNIRRFVSALHHSGVIPSTDRFTRIMLDVFYINSRTLFGGFLVIFSFVLLFTGIGFFKASFSVTTVMFILFQSISILMFYGLVWKFEPYSLQYHHDMRELKGRLVTKRFPEWAVVALFGTAAVLVLFGIISTIILLPGFTVNKVLSLTGIEGLEYHLVLIGILLASQYFIVRFFHGISSRELAEQFSDAQIARLRCADTIPEDKQKSKNVSGDPAAPEADMKREVAGALLESKIYKVEKKTLLGAFPVYIVNPDFSVILDEQVLALITGYLGNARVSSGDSR